MKTRIVFILLLIAAKIAALNPAGTYTFVDPCTPFAQFAPIPNTYGCYSFTASNGGHQDPNAYYTWQFGDGASATGTQVLHCYSPVTVTTVFTFTLTYNTAALCGVQPTQSYYTLTLQPVPQGECVLACAGTTVNGLQVTLGGRITIPEVSIDISWGDASVTSNTYTHNYSSCGSYIIRERLAYWHPPQDTCYAYCAVNLKCQGGSSGLKEFSTHELKVFPNPAGQLLRLEATGMLKDLSISTISGQVVYRSQAESIGAEIDLQGFAPGCYFITVRFADGSAGSARFMKN